MMMADQVNSNDQTPQDQTPQDQASQDQAPESKQDFSSFIPEDYKDKDWVKQNAKDPESFFKFVDNQNQLIGRKGPARPEADAPKEEWDKYFNGLGRPEKPEDYEFETPEGAPEDFKRDENSEKLFKSLLHDAGVPKDMAKRLQVGFDKIVLEQMKQQNEETAKLDQEFNKATEKLFGENRDSKIAGIKKLLAENADPSVLGKLETLDNDSLVVLSSAVHGIAEKYIGEDAFKGGPPKTLSGDETYEQLSARQREIMGKEGFNDFQHPEHKKLMQENADIVKKMRQLKS